VVAERCGKVCKPLAESWVDWIGVIDAVRELVVEKSAIDAAFCVVRFGAADVNDLAAANAATKLS